MNKSREQFEAWMKSLPYVLNLGFDKSTGQYILQEDRDRWEAWEASRKALILELPETESYEDGKDQWGYQEYTSAYPADELEKCLKEANINFK